MKSCVAFAVEYPAGAADLVLKEDELEKDDDIKKQIEDIIDVEDDVLALKDIESIVHNIRIRKRYENEYKDRLYSTILKSLTHESYPENEAKSLLYEILEHMGHLNRLLGRNVGVAVASMDYLSNIKNILSDPKIIEEVKSRFVAVATTKDELTQLYLRDVFEVVIKKEIGRANRKNTSLCLLLIDIDDFKRINDTNGHLIGDEVLNRIGVSINESVRDMDLAARYGGDEIAIIMPGSDIEDAYRAAQRIRKTIEQMQFRGFSVTVSIGVSQTDQHISMPIGLINAADSALYRAKDKGKNQVIKSAKAH